MIKLLDETHAAAGRPVQPAANGRHEQHHHDNNHSAARNQRTADLARALRAAASLEEAVTLRNEITLLNYALVPFAVGRCAPPGPHRDDLLSEAACGLIEAAARFDPARGSSFSSFAMLIMRRRIIAFLAHAEPCSLSEQAGRRLYRTPYVVATGAE